MRRIVMLSVLAAAVALTGCGGDGGSGRAETDRAKTTSTSTSSTTTSSSSTTTTTAHRTCPAVGTTDTKDSARPPVDQLLTDVAVTSDGCIDTITFTFRPNAAPAPGYQVEYDVPPFFNSAGDTVTPSGSAFMRVRLQPAWIADLSEESASPTYTGPRVITPTGTTWVRGLVLYDATEAVVGWAIGLDQQRPFEVEASSAKLVIRVG